VNIEAALAQEAAQDVVETSERKALFVMPRTSELPNDGILEYVNAETVYDFSKLKPNVVVQIDVDKYDVLKLIAEHQVLFDVALRVLAGVPMTDYDPQFDQVTWNLERVAYAPLISELALEAEVEAQEKHANASQHDREREQFTRADGTVKKQTAFDMAEDANDTTSEEHDA